MKFQSESRASIDITATEPTPVDHRQETMNDDFSREEETLIENDSLVARDPERSSLPAINPNPQLHTSTKVSKLGKFMIHSPKAPEHGLEPGSRYAKKRVNVITSPKQNIKHSSITANLRAGVL